MKYKLINKTTGEEHICEKVVIDGWDYYVSENYKDGDYVILPISLSLAKCVNGTTFIEGTQKVIATNNPSIDIPKVVEEVDVLTNTMINLYLEKIKDLTKRFFWKAGFKSGYNKSQETHPYSDDDMIEFNEWCNKNYEFDNRCNQWFHGNGYYTTKELLQLWKEQKPKTLYYE